MRSEGIYLLYMYFKRIFLASATCVWLATAVGLATWPHLHLPDRSAKSSQVSSLCRAACGVVHNGGNSSNRSLGSFAVILAAVFLGIAAACGFWNIIELAVQTEVYNAVADESLNRAPRCETEGKSLREPTPGQAGNGAAALTAFSLACAFVLDFYLM